jgi:hypothetical protein
MRVLVAVDGSACSTRAVKYAERSYEHDLMRR